MESICQLIPDDVPALSVTTNFRFCENRRSEIDSFRLFIAKWLISCRLGLIAILFDVTWSVNLFQPKCCSCGKQLNPAIHASFDLMLPFNVSFGSRKASPQNI
jgi:hypothetical protein